MSTPASVAACVRRCSCPMSPCARSSSTWRGTACALPRPVPVAAMSCSMRSTHKLFLDSAVPAV